VRFYKIELAPPPTSSNPSTTSGAASPSGTSAESTKNSSGQKGVIYTSYVNGMTDPGALNVYLDLYTVPSAQPYGAANVQIWGIPLSTISNAFDFNGWNIQITAGFQKGLPLANPNQQGLILKGRVLQSFGNWQGTDMNLNLVSIAGYVDTFNGGGNWPSGQPLAAALETYLKTAMPGYTFVTPTLNPNLVFPYEQPLAYSTFESFAKWIKQYSKASIGGAYPGVDMRIDGTNIVAYDNTIPTTSSNSAQDTKTTPTIRIIDLQFIDLVGQPIWIDLKTIQFKCPMRADIKLGDVVKMPVGYFGIAPNSSSTPWNYRDKSAQSGYFQILEVHHLGNYRQPDGNSWVTVFQGINVNPPESAK
jgi:hypothetical protein